MRKLYYIEPPRVFINLQLREEDMAARLWIRNVSEIRYIQQVVYGLHGIGVMDHARWQRKRDLVERECYYKYYWEVKLIDIHDAYMNEDMLRIAIQSQFRMMQDCRVEWLSAHKILNLKIWHRQQG